MKKTTPYISEEHIVAWLDQELVADNDFRSSIEQTPALKTAASEYAAISEAIAHSMSDKRFALSPSVDSRVRASLQQELARNRKTVRTPERAPNAQPIPNTSPDRSKRILVRRTSYALAFALLLCAVWFGMPTQNQPTTASNGVSQPTPVAQAPVNTSNVETTPTVPIANTNTSAVIESPVTSAPIKHNSARSMASNNEVKNSVVPTSQQNQPTAQPVASTTEQADPAGMMISHRFAKLVKATPAVVVNQQDRM